MKRIIFLLTLSLIILFAAPSSASFRIRKVSAVAAKVKDEQTSTGTITNNDKTGFLSKAAHLLNPDRYRHHRGNRNSGMGLTSMILGILSIVCIGQGGFVLGILAIIFGSIGIRRHERHALAGLIMGCVSVLLTILAIMLFILFF